MQRVLHLSPHPDDELIGIPASLMTLRDQGWEIINVACGLGRPEQRARREREVREACRRSRFQLVIPSMLVTMSWSDDHGAAQEAVEVCLKELLDEYDPQIVVTPSPHDRHHAHEIVARAARQALQADDTKFCGAWWLWSIWGALPLPSVLTRFDDARLSEILEALEAYAGELVRNDYRRLVRGRSELMSSLGPELVFGFGTAGVSGFAEILTEAMWIGGRWVLGTRRTLDGSSPLKPPTTRDLTHWINAVPAVGSIWP